MRKKIDKNSFISQKRLEEARYALLRRGKQIYNFNSWAHQMKNFSICAHTNKIIPDESKFYFKYEAENSFVIYGRFAFNAITMFNFPPKTTNYFHNKNFANYSNGIEV